MNLYFDRAGQPLPGTLAWAALFKDKDYQIVAQDYTDNKKYLISTVWLGLDHDMFDSGKPLIFETMVFSGDRKDSGLDMEQYSTEAEAIAGHVDMLVRWSNK